MVNRTIVIGLSVNDIHSLLMEFIRCFEPLIKGHLKTRAELGRVFCTRKPMAYLVFMLAGKKEAKS